MTTITDSDSGRLIATIPLLLDRPAYEWLCSDFGLLPKSDLEVLSSYLDAARANALIARHDELEPLDFEDVPIGMENLAGLPTEWTSLD